MQSEPRPVLVIGATGMQGGAVARRLLRDGLEVLFLARDPESRRSVALQELGARVVRGDLEDIDSLRNACLQAPAVFSVLTTSPPDDVQREVRHAAHIVEAVASSGVRQLIHSSVSATGWRADHPDVDPLGTDLYWDNKEEAERRVREADVENWLILKPAFYMDNLLKPKAERMFPALAGGEILSASSPDAELALIASEDLGGAVAAGVAHPQHFHRQEIELAGDAITFAEIAEVLTEVTGIPVKATFGTPAEIEERLGERLMWSGTQKWLDDVGYPARPAHAAAFGLRTTGFRDWAASHREALAHNLGRR
jgi:uncharacterized protein YbjT (DUF2867 family)